MAKNDRSSFATETWRALVVKARDKGRLLRQKYGFIGRVDVQDLADRMGLQVDLWDLPAHEVHEITLGRSIGVSVELDDQERRWAIAHAIRHRLMHPGNHWRRCFPDSAASACRMRRRVAVAVVRTVAAVVVIAPPTRAIRRLAWDVGAG